MISKLENISNELKKKILKISFKKKEVEDYVRDNNLLVAISNIKK